MKPVPKLLNDFILNESEYHACKAWLADFPRGEPRRLANDLADYENDTLDLTKDGKTAVIVQWNMSSNLWRAEAANLSKAKQLESGALQLLDVTSGPGGKVLASGLDNQLWLMNTDGSQRTVFTDVHGAGAPFQCGRFVLFLRETIQGAGEGLGRVAADGSNVTQMVGGHLNSAVCSPDGKFVFYDNIDQPQKIWRIPVEGGAATAIARIPGATVVGELGVSPDGKLLAYLHRQYDENAHLPEAWKLVVISGEDGTPVKTFQVPEGIDGIRWSPDGKGLEYCQSQDGAENLWEQPLTGRKPRQLTHFTSGFIWDFSWSADGKQLLLTHGELNGDVILLNGFR